MPEILTQIPGASQPVFPEKTKLTKAPPDKDTVYNYLFSMEKGYAWIKWTDTVPAYAVPKGAKFNDIFVSTEDTIQVGYLADVLITHQVPMLVSGNTGTGKTILVRSTHAQRHGQGRLSEHLPQLLGADVGACLAGHHRQPARQAAQGRLRPALWQEERSFSSTTSTCPRCRLTATSRPSSCSASGWTTAGWYDLKDCTFRELVDIQFVAAMGPPGGGRNPVTPRYIRHFNLVWMTDYSPSSLERIFQTVFQWHFNKDKFPGEVTSLCNNIVLSTIEIFNVVGRELLPTPSKSHYTFNLRDISKVFQGMTQGSPKTVSPRRTSCASGCTRPARLLRPPDRPEGHGLVPRLVCTQLDERFKKDWTTSRLSTSTCCCTATS